jgi:hypothetical protein
VKLAVACLRSATVMTLAVTAKAGPAMTGNLSVSVSAGPAPALVTLVGECDITTAPQLLDALSTQIAGDGRLVVVNLSALTFLDAAGLHALLDARAGWCPGYWNSPARATSSPSTRT